MLFLHIIFNDNHISINEINFNYKKNVLNILFKIMY